MNKEEIKKEIERLQKLLVEEETELAEIFHSNRENVLLDDENGNLLVSCWAKEEDLNDFKYLKEKNYGQFLINGNIKPFEYFKDGKWTRCNDIMDVRFLK